MQNPQYMEKLIKYYKDYKQERLIKDQEGKILNKDAYEDFVAWAKMKKTSFIPPYILFCRLSVVYVQWFRYRSSGVTYFYGYRLATDAEMAERDALKAVEIVKQVKVIVEPQNGIPDWQKERNELARIERMENLEKSKAARAAINTTE